MNTYPLLLGDSSEIGPSSKPESQLPEWVLILETLAADKKHDLHPNAVQFWMEKLKNYSTKEIREALLAYRGRYMPSCDDIIDQMDARQQDRRDRAPAFVSAKELRQRQDWEAFKVKYNLDRDMSYQQWWVSQHKAELKQLAEKMSMKKA